jgi:hypothetical protein
MNKRLLVLVAALSALLALPSLASANGGFAFEGSKQSGQNFQLFAADDDGGSVIKLPIMGQNPLIAPNLAFVAYSKVFNNKTGASQLHFLNVNTLEDINTKASCLLGPASWAPDSSAVLCITASSKGSFVTGVGLNTVTTNGTVSIIVPAPRADVWGFGWSPDSSTVVWGQSRFNDTAASAQLLSTTIGSRKYEVLANKGAYPVWGPSKIAFQRFTREMVARRTWIERQQVWTLDPARGASSAKALTAYRAKGFVWGPVATNWTPDGTKLVGQIIGEDYSQPMYVTMNGKVHTFGPSNASVFGVSADGTQAAVSGGQFDGSKAQPVYGVALSTKGSSLLLKNAFAPSVTANWQP